MKPLKCVIHWTAGHLGPSLPYYHRIIDREGVVHNGKFAIEDNCRLPLVAGKYAPHVAGANGGTIGIAMVGMFDAQSPKQLGTQPLLAVQWHACVDLTAQLFKQYGITVNGSTLVGHCEVDKRWGRPQGGKWDPWVRFPEWTWAAGLKPEQIGDLFRDSVARRVKELS
jgi:hypothetical protein